jgi:hypothetical protein
MQVVGVVRQGLDLLDLLDDVPRSPDDTPLMRIKVVKCGNTNAQVRVGPAMRPLSITTAACCRHAQAAVIQGLVRCNRCACCACARVLP